MINEEKCPQQFKQLARKIRNLKITNFSSNTSFPYLD